MTNTSTATPDLDGIQELVLDVVKQGQDFALETIRTAVETVRPLVSTLPTAPLADLLPDPSATVDASLAFADQLMAAQRDFTRELVSVLTAKGTAA